jgi:hypothetical protein
MGSFFLFVNHKKSNGNYVHPSDIRQNLSQFRKEDWLSILKLANQWECKQIRKLAIERMEMLHLPESEMILLGKRYDIQKWIQTAYLKLCSRHQALTMDDVSTIGVPALLQISAIREQVALGRKSQREETAKELIAKEFKDGYPCEPSEEVLRRYGLLEPDPPLPEPEPEPELEPQITPVPSSSPVPPSSSQPSPAKKRRLNADDDDHGSMSSLSSSEDEPDVPPLTVSGSRARGEVFFFRYPYSLPHLSFTASASSNKTATTRRRGRNRT